MFFSLLIVAVHIIPVFLKGRRGEKILLVPAFSLALVIISVYLKGRSKITVVHVISVAMVVIPVFLKAVMREGMKVYMVAAAQVIIPVFIKERRGGKIQFVPVLSVAVVQRGEGVEASCGSPVLTIP